MNCIIIGGFLGSGKTTYVNFLMKHFSDLYPDKKMALLINEFGEIPVDATMMDSGNYSMCEITGGCICCTLKGVLADAVNELREKEDPDFLIIEATGLAVPSEISVSIGLAGECRVFSQLCVDADQYRKLAGRLAVYDRQLSDSDTILLTKEDLRGVELLAEVEAELTEELERRKCSKNYEAAFEALSRCFEGVSNNTLSATACCEHSQNHHHQKHELTQDICQFTHRFTGIVDLSVIKSSITKTVSSVVSGFYRIKGIVNTFEGWKALQFVDGEMAIKDVKPPENIESFIVFIGKCGIIEGVKDDFERNSL